MSQKKSCEHDDCEFEATHGYCPYAEHGHNHPKESSPESFREVAKGGDLIISYCDKKHKCLWKCFALDAGGLCWGKISIHLEGWIKAHAEHCGGKLIEINIPEALKQAFLDGRKAENEKAAKDFIDYHHNPIVKGKNEEIAKLTAKNGWMMDRIKLLEARAISPIKLLDGVHQKEIEKLEEEAKKREAVINAAIRYFSISVEFLVDMPEDEVNKMREALAAIREDKEQ